MKHILCEPYTKDSIAVLKVGDTVMMTGTIYAARDAAHKRLVQMIEDGEELPFDLENAAIYYAGPTPARPGYPIGSAGPTTSYRMDPYTPALLDRGVSITIGKGPRGGEVIESIRGNSAIYLAAIGGAAALIAQCVESAEVVAFEELGTEAIRKLVVKDMPLVVATDSRGESIYR